MAFLRIERTPVGFANLGLFGFDHLQLVLQTSAYDPILTQDDWRVVEGVVDPGQTLGVEGADGTTTLSLANQGKTGDDLIAAIGTPSSRGSRVLATSDPLGAWSVISSMAAQIDGQRLPYTAYSLPGSITPTVNSTSVIASLLFYAGFDISTSWPSGIRFSPGWTTLIGTLDNDNLALSQSFTTLLGGVGDDTLTGSHSLDRVDWLYGGVGNDTLRWTEGVNYLHGGQTRLAYALDGIDTVDYTGAGTVVITGNQNYVENKTPTFTAVHDGGTDYLYSIERIEWATTSDHIIVKDGAGLIRDGLEMKLGGQASAGHGDTLDFSQQTDGILANASANGDALLVKDRALAGDETGLWVESAEWLVGSLGDDQVYAASGLLGVEGGAGNDLIDARGVTAFSGASPAGYDIEIDGGEGSDTLVADAGRTLLHGGAGADVFVLTAMTGSEGAVEIVIDDADASDRILVPYNFFNGSGGGVDGSDLMTLLGGIGTYSDMLAGGLSAFIWSTEPQIWFGSDPAVGQITFYGEIDYTLEGNDLLVHLYLGDTLDFGPDKVMVFDPATETIIRIKDFQVGMLGLTFYDFGADQLIDVPGLGLTVSLANWDTAATALTTDVFSAPLAARPDAADMSPAAEQMARDAAPPVSGSAGDDVITLTSVARVEAGAGNDTITGSASADIIDGGSGADSMSGGGGNDSYIVDDIGDVIVEAAGSGHDRVTSSVDYVLSDWVEDLTLTGGAVSGTGNALANTLDGDDIGNLLSGGDGNDVLAGETGDDTLVGGAGSDTYVYGLGDGRDTIVDGIVAGETSTLVLTGGITADAASFLRLQSSPDDLVLRFADGGQITLAGYYSTANVGSVDVTFDDGSGWSTSQFAALAAGAMLVAELPPVAIDDPYLIAGRASIVVPAASLLANDISPSGRALTIVSVTATGGGSATLRADGDIDVTAAANGTETSFTYVVSDGVGTASAVASVGFDLNHAPTVTTALSDVAATAGTAFSVALPGGLFTDADWDPLTVSARLADGSPLPDWLAFDAASWTLSGTPPSSAAGNALDVVLTASDGLDAVDAPLHIAVSGAGTPGVVVTGDNKANLLTGTAGDDTITGAGGNDTMQGNSGNDVFLVAGTSSGLDIFDGGDGFDVILGSGGDDLVTLAFSPGNLAGIERIDGGGGNDTLRGSSGDDLIDLSAITLSSVELIDGGAGVDTIIGSAGGDTISGGSSQSFIYGGGGDDTLLVSSGVASFYDGGDGYDRLLGTAGDDLIAIDNLAGNLAGIELIDGGAGNDTLRGTSGDDVIDLSAIQLAGIELIYGAGGSDTIIGSAGDDTISGGGGQSVIRGGDGNDTLLVASAAACVYDGGGGFDRVLGTSGDDTITLLDTPGNLAGIELIDGGGGTDILRGTAANDRIDLSAITLVGISRIQGGGGDDTLTGSAGDDTLSGGSGNDLYVMTHGGGHDVIADFQRTSNGLPLADVIDVSAWGFTSLAEVMAHTTVDAAGSAIISHDPSNSVTLAGIAPAQLAADDFRFA